MFRAAVSAGLILIASASPAAASVDAYRKPDKDWVKGPVRWILSDDEEKAWKKQTTDEARAAFIRTFWEKRDPTPGTPDNEFEVIFWKRVEEADKAFKVAIDTDPGSLTDMGRAFLLLGPPASTSKDARGRSLWKYEPNPVTGMTETLELTFAPSATGAPLLLSRKILETYVEAHPATRGIGWKLPEAPAAELVPAGAGEEAPEEDTPESRRQQGLLDDLLAKGGGPARVPFQATYDFYAAVDGSTLTAITLEVPREAAHGGGDAALRAFARLLPQAEGGRPVNLTGDLPFVPASDSPASSYIYQARRNLKPGAWKVAIIVEDKVIAGQTGTLVADLRVPDFSDKTFALSSVALLAGFRQVGADVGPDEEPHGAGPYVLGSFRLVPRAVPALARQDALAFYYQVYNPTIDAASGRPNLEISYAFFLKDGADWKPFRKPIVKMQRGQVELYAIDLKDFLLPNQPLPADFRMDMTIVDGPTRRELKHQILFSVR